MIRLAYTPDMEPAENVAMLDQSAPHPDLSPHPSSTDPPTNGAPADGPATEPVPDLAPAADTLAADVPSDPDAIRREQDSRGYEAAKTDLAHISVRILNLKEELKELQKELKEATMLVRIMEIRCGYEVGDPAEVAELTKAAERKSVTLEAVADPAWRDVPVTDLIAYGIPEKLAERYIEAGYETLGKLEDLRADEHKGGLRSLKGIGQKKVDQTEDALLAWFAANRDKDVLATAMSDAAASAMQTLATFTEAANNLPPVPDTPAPEPDAPATEVQITDTPVAPPQAEWLDAVAECEEIMGLCDDIPEEGAGFAISVQNQASGMRDWIKEHEHVTSAQLDALAGWRTGLEQWEGRGA